MKQMLAIAALAGIMASCNTNYEKTASGLTYKIFKGNGKQKLKSGDIVKINATIKITPRDTILFSTGGHLPEYVPVDTSSRLSHDYNEVLKLCSVGDSLVVVSQVDTLVKRNMAQYNNMLKRGDQIFTSMKLLQAFSSREDQAKDQQKELEKERAKEVAEMESYLKKKGIKAQKTENGVFVEQTSAGSSEKAVNGKQVTVNYRGSLLNTGKVFDSNMDTSFHHVQPFSFVLGAGQTIRGWEEGLQTLSKGAKGNIYIPSLLGYGPPGAPPAIPAYAPLKFEVEILNIANAPARPAQMPGAGMQGDPRQQDPREQQQGQEQQDPHQQQGANQQSPK
ncbi:FKBP-type peptidyl-prolyl cis-trans isomerase [Segetibacter koreensis]|uniref:FKBP-type peptidyl-prolyl cis-trans isomerase n=1 Tax=Segetibacter koreensis TaxID=398037 RepID=UPI00037F1EC6|nr:FKBP-type peptidyl-prolyl cis-trans isomerase [Segetibacter koreensis]